MIVFLFPESQQDVFMFGHKTTMARMIGNDVPLVGLAGKPPGKQFFLDPDNTFSGAEFQRRML